VGKLVAAQGEALQAGAGPSVRWLRVTGADDEFLHLAPLTMLTRARGYENDRAVLDALRGDATAAVIDSSFLAQPVGRPFGGGPQRFTLSVTEAELRERPWEPIPVTIRDRRPAARVHIIGVLDHSEAARSSSRALTSSDRQGHSRAARSVRSCCRHATETRPPWRWPVPWRERCWSAASRRSRSTS
jgi:hypothetical protein